MTTITLTCTPTGWMATFRGPMAQEIRAAFGTDTIPTAYTAAAPADKVLRDVGARFRDCAVCISPLSN
jgi:hypothetical protein